MDESLPPDGNADETLAAYFGPIRERARGTRAVRLEEAERELRACIEVSASQILSADELGLLAAERQFGTVGAAARLGAPILILKALPFFVSDPAWFGCDLDGRRFRLGLAERLAGAICTDVPAEDVPTVPRAARQVRIAVRRARRAFDYDRAMAVLAARGLPDPTLGFTPSRERDHSPAPSGLDSGGAGTG
jgi:hypothetical protein